MYIVIREKGEFSITTMGRLKKYLGLIYMWEVDNYGKHVGATMSENAKNMVKDLEALLALKIKIIYTPGFPGNTLQKFQRGC